MDLKFVTIETFVIQFILLLLVIYILNRFVFKPYLAYLDEWEDKQKKLEEDYKNIDGLIQDANNQKDEILKKAKQKWNDIISEAESLANTKRDNIIADAEKKAREQSEFSKGEIEKERQSMLSQIKANVIDMTLRLNEKLFKDQKVSKDFVEKNIDSL